jgi:hypothetical protein
VVPQAQQLPDHGLQRFLSSSFLFVYNQQLENWQGWSAWQVTDVGGIQARARTNGCNDNDFDYRNTDPGSFSNTNFQKSKTILVSKLPD